MNLKLAHLGDLVGMHFNIPYYQRGYRWETKQVLDLLDDLFEFKQSHPLEKQFYCLQPLATCRNNSFQDENLTVFDVIDGQQRLTTLFLVMKYLNIESFDLRYERAINKNDDKHLWQNGILCYETLQSLSDEDQKDNPDFFYMKQAMASIKNWFEEKSKQYPGIKRIIEDILRNPYYKKSSKPFYVINEDPNDKQPDVRFIWYEDEPTNSGSIETFKRLNYGKTPLTASELIKALLFQCDVYELERRAEMKQITFRMSTEWDAMEKALQDDLIWSMLFPKKYDKAAHIDIILSFVARDLEEKNCIKVKVLETDKDYDYLVFNKYIDQKKQKDHPYQDIVKELWIKIQDTYAIFRCWFDDRELYHLTGLYLTLLNQNIKENLQTLHILVDNFKKKDRQSYIDWLKKDKIGPLIRFNEKKFDTPEDASFENLYYGKFSNEIVKILLVYNVDTMMKHSQNKAYFPFTFFHNITPSLEHIHPQHLHNEDIDFITRCQWFKDKYLYLKNEDSISEELKSAISKLYSVLYISTPKEENEKKLLKDKELLYKEKEFEYSQLLKVIDKHFDELADINERELHNISNLALVDNITNIRLSNGLLHNKRAILQQISNEYDLSEGKQGSYIFIGTKKVFNKEYTSGATDLRFWTKNDRTNYLKDLKNTYNEYVK